MFKLIKIQLEIFASLQTLFPPLKIDIFCRIAPLSFIKKSSKFNLKISQPWKIFGPLQTLFPPLKIDIFCRIVPLSFIEKLIKIELEIFAPCKRCFLLWKLTFSVASSPLFFIKNMKWKLLEKFVPPANADSPFENRHFLTHRPPIISRCSPLTMRTCSPLTMRRPPPIGSPHRGILCVEKIGSAAPELQEWPGTPSKPVKSTNGPFYWLTRKRAPPWCWSIRWGTL